jgi:hypothetical protein
MFHLSLFLSPIPYTHIHRMVRGGKSDRILEFRPKYRWKDSFTFRPYCPWGRSTRYPLNWLGSPWSRAERDGQEKISILAGNWTSVIQIVALHFTVCNISAPGGREVWTSSKFHCKSSAVLQPCFLDYHYRITLEGDSQWRDSVFT